MRATAVPRQGEVLDQPDAEALQLSVVLFALSEPVRLQVVRDLAHAEAPMACNAFSLPVTKATMTHHFRVLREAGVVEQRNVGNRRLNSLRTHDLESRFPGLLKVVLDAPV